MKYAYKLLKMFTLIIFMVPGIVYAQAIKDSILKNYTQEDYEEFVKREMRGEIPDASGPVPSMRAVNDILVNNNGGATGTGLFTQSETSILAFGSTVLVGFNDSGSRDGGANKFTGWSYSTDGGATFMDGGTLPTSTIGDAGDPVFARDESTGRIYYTTLGFSSPNTIQVFASDDNGVTWDAPVVGTPGGTNEDKQWIAVDNFAGSGNGNVYLISRRFAGDQGIYVFTSTDNGATFGPDGGVKIVNSTGAGDNKQGAFIAVGTDHSVYAFWMDDVTNDLNVRKSTDFGATFGATVTFVTGLAGTQVNNGLNLTGQRQGSASFSGFRSNSFPHVAVNPVSGHLYLVYNDNPAGDDKGNIYMVMSDDGAATWSAPVQINDDGTTTDQWQPTIAVTPDGNNLGIFYYSREEDATDNNLFTYNGRKASISGSIVTFSSSFVISELQSLPEFGRDNQVNSTYMGDYNCASATNNIYHVVWSDNRDDLDETGAGNRKDPNVYYKAVPVGSGSPVAACQSVSIAADENCQAMVTAEDVDDGSFHPDGIPVTLSLSPEGPYELGVTNVTLTVDDGFGGVATCNATITVNDETAPVAPPAPADVNVEC
ncbi:MAG: sialidase family protein, partial [bacterium]